MKRKSIIQRLTLPLSELETYYRQRRKERFESNAPFTGVKLRRALHPVLLIGLKIMHLLSGQRVMLIGDQRTPTTRPKIFAATHIGWDDIEMIFSAITDHAYLFWGDPRESYKTIDGFLLDLNGAIICDTDQKEDRRIGKETAVRWLEQGGNLLIFPEGVWNTSENQLVQHFFPGTAEMAIRTKADIVPIAIEQFGKEYCVNIGSNIAAATWTPEQKQELTNHLRDTMATLKWEILEKQPVIARTAIPANARNAHRERILRQAKGVYAWQDFLNQSFHPRSITTPQEAFAHLSRIEPTSRNAFLWGAKGK